ncbi:hypothetical protein ACJMK2_032362 [Sinanodonta woodiana]|uniref:Delta-like protein n=1 Tax=Sinanodonta woodiana TaxID=1069815 RepID=A0ABD3X5J6_SINWO
MYLAVMTPASKTYFCGSVLSNGRFQVLVITLNNNRGITRDGRCCSGPSSYPPCFGACSTFLRICLLHRWHGNPRACGLGFATNHIYEKNNLATTNEVHSRDMFLEVNFQYSWPGNITLLVEAWHDIDGQGTINDNSQLILRTEESLELFPSPMWITSSSVTPTSEIEFSYRVICNENYHGNSCEIFCRPRDDSIGHFRCAGNGSRVCMAGWEGEFCDRAMCTEKCLNASGICERPFECKCRIGWYGDHCDKCEVYPGCLNGNCFYPGQCICYDGWFGKLCDIDLNYCFKNNPCLHGGSCFRDNINNYTCACPKGFAGPNCQYHLCEGEFCENGGTCMMTNVYGRQCLCAKRFYGHRCQHSLLSCDETFCKNGGKCIENGGERSCDCIPGYFGNQCQDEIDECTSDPCLNGGTCRDGVNGYVCECSTGYAGSQCATHIDPCDQFHCFNGGTCLVMTESLRPVCNCRRGYSGERCEVADPCRSFQCFHGGSCTVKAGDSRPFCLCATEYGGDHCERNINPCRGIFCQNGGKCAVSPMQNGFVCFCKQGYTGEVCETKINNCESSPCKKNEICKSYSDSFICICPSGFSGKRCQKSLMVSDQRQNTLHPQDESDKGSAVTAVKVASSSSLTKKPRYLTFLISATILFMFVSIVDQT